MKYEIDIEGLPEGWRAVAYRIPIDGESYLYKGKIYIADGSISDYLVVEKIQPRRIVLELTQEEHELMLKIPIEQRLLSDPSMMSLIEKIKSVKAK